MYLFEKPLIRGTLLKRKSQFTALIDIDGEELIAHIPTTNRIGDVENKNRYRGG
jgi:sugar fermentation stimulation protein A